MPGDFSIAEWLVRPRLGTVGRGDKSVRVEPKIMRVLVCLAEHPGDVVEKDYLIRTVWPDTFVTDDVLTKCISELRRIFEDNAREPHFIQTIPKIGYRLIAPIRGELVPLAANPNQAQTSTEVLPRPAAGPAARLRWIAVAGLSLVLVVGAYIAGQRLQSLRTQPRGRLMLAVLPFQNLSGDPDREYFSDGMTEELITSLGRIAPSRLGVIARTSVMPYKHTAKRVDEISHELGVDYVVEGSVRREGDRVRITAQLVRAKDQSHVWAEEYDRDIQDILRLQAEVAQTIAGEISHDLLARPTTTSGSVNPEAYEAYLWGRYFWNKGTEAGYRTALKHFQEAINKDPTYAPAYAGLAEAHIMLGYWLMVPPKDAFPLATVEAEKALRLDSSLAEAHAVLAYSKFVYDWEWSESGKEFQKALQLNPNSASIHQWYAQFLGDSGHMDEAGREISVAHQLDPLSLQVNLILAAYFYMVRKYDTAVEQLQKTLELDPNFQPVYPLLGAVYREQGEYDKAAGAEERGLAMAGLPSKAVSELREAFSSGGIRAFWAKEAELLEMQSHHTYIPPVEIAMDYSCLHDHDRAFEWLEKAYQERSGWFLELRIDPVWDPLRSDPRFQGLLQRIPKP